jgi:PKD repeat protein
MDWWSEPGVKKHPGGPFFSATWQKKICPDGDESKAYLTPVNEPPIASFSISPSSPNAKQNIIFDASSSKDVCGKIEAYRWEFGDGSRDEGRIVEHAYSEGGDVKAVLEISDDDGTSANYSMDIKINQLPVPDIGYDPKVPIVGENITFNAIGSRDADGLIVGYEWEFEDGHTSTMSRQVHRFDRKGNNMVNLTVFDDKNARNSTSKMIRVNEPPHASMTFMPIHPYAGEDIVFDATSSRDSDGLVMEYKWDLGDGSMSFEPKVYHNYKNGGNYTVELTIKDNDGAMSKNSSLIRIKKSEIFSQEWLVKADELFEQGMCDEAIKAYNASYAIDPHNSKAMFGKGRAYYAKGEYHEALLRLTEAIESTQYKLSNSDYADMWMYKSKALEKLGQDLEADYALDKAEELDPSRPLEPLVEPCTSRAPSPFNETVSKP